MIPVFALILAGGRGSRLGNVDKAFIELAALPLLAHVLARLERQCRTIVVSANGDPKRFASFLRPVVADETSDSAGPLAGLLAGLEFFARTYPEATDVVSLPVDTPFAPSDLVIRLFEARTSADAMIALARSGDRVHPTVGLWPVAIRQEMRRALAGGEHGILRFASRHKWVAVDWPDEPYDPFFNINTPEDLVMAQALLTSGSGK